MSLCPRSIEFYLPLRAPRLTSLALAVLVLASLGCTEGDATPGGSEPAVPQATVADENSSDESESNAVNAGQDDSDQAAADAADGKVLRHAVFFSFKDDSTPEDVQKVVDAFAALPGKISQIIDFQHGTNNSPEGLDDGFTHCFLLTFQDEAGRAAYLPHPAHTGEFADTLRPHMKDVFVIDYWGTPPSVQIERELKHAVFFKFKDDASKEDIQKVEAAFEALPSKINTIKAFEWGRNNSPEKNDDGFTHCFMVTFDSEAGREAYLPHADHKAFVEVLMPVLDKVRVLDFWEN